MGNKQTLTYLCTTKAVSGDNTLITGVAGKRIVIKDLVVQNETTTDTTVLIKDGSTTIWRALLGAKDAITFSFNDGEELWLEAGSSLIVNLSGANSHGCNVRYTMA